MKKSTSKICAFVLALAILCSFITTMAFGQSNNSASIEDRLLEAAAPVLQEYRKHYDVWDTSVSIKDITRNESGDSYIKYDLNFTAELIYDSVTDLPQIRGLSAALGVNSAGLTVSELSAALQSDTVMSALAETEMTAQAISTITQSGSRTFGINETPFTSESNIIGHENLESLLPSLVVGTAVDFIERLQYNYIGVASDFTIEMAAIVNSSNELVRVEYGLIADTYTEDIAAAIPASESVMFNQGYVQAETLFDNAVCSLSAINATDAIDFYYNGSAAAAYANTYTSNAAEGYCSTHGCNMAQDSTKYNSAYTFYCCNDCSNFVSQAMLAGGVPADQATSNYANSSNVWCVGSKAWRGTISMLKYFTVHNKYWTETNAANCPVGGIMMQYNSSGACHVMMTVYNDTVTRKYSAHTYDRKETVYSSSLTSLGGLEVKFFRFNTAEMIPIG